MKQLITRIDERLHRRLRDRAARDGRSVNALVTDMIEKALDSEDPHARLRARMKALGMLVEPPAPRGPVPTHDELRSMLTAEDRRAIIREFEADRKHR